MNGMQSGTERRPFLFPELADGQATRIYVRRIAAQTLRMTHGNRWSVAETHLTGFAPTDPLP